MLKRNKGRCVLLAACLFAVLLIPAARATPGALDPSFGTGGTVTTQIASANESARAVALQPDGKIVAAGRASNGSNDDFALVRYEPDGSLDTSFNGTGKVTTPIGSGDDGALAVALQPDGKVVAAGYAGNGSDDDFALARYNADGSLDTSFNGTGTVLTPIGTSDDYGEALALQPDGKIVVAGDSYNGSDDDFALARYNADGSLDTSFNGSGKLTTAFVAGGDDCAYGVAVQPDGRIVAGGSGWTGSKLDFALARFDTDGSLDSTFNGTGKVTTSFGTDSDIARALALQPDGKIVAAGYTTKPGATDFALARYNVDGTLDAGFGAGGETTTAIGTYDLVSALALQPDGKIVAAGSTWDPPTIASQDSTLIRLNGDGTLDSSFGSGGKVRASIGSKEDVASAVALQADGKIVAAGVAVNGTDEDFALARYLGSSTLTVAMTGSGSGTVTSSPSGISCGSTCSAHFDAVPVTLTAAPTAGSSFLGWSGDCSGTGTCSVTMSADHAVTARFESDKTLTLAKTGSGGGTVTSSPAAISCGSTCIHSFKYGTAVTVTAVPSAGSSFVGWSGACSGHSACILTMNADRAATARFENNKTLTLSKAGGGSGTVTSSPAGVSCGLTCAHSFVYRTTVTLTAVASAGSRFTGWSGACTGTGSCTTAMSANRVVTATFKPLCVVPRLKGKTIRGAKAALRRAHCSLGKVMKAYSARVRNGRVIAERPKQGRKLAAGSKVKLELSKGKKV